MTIDLHAHAYVHDDFPLIKDRPEARPLEAFARAAGLHPDVVRRFVALGLVEATRDAAGQLWFAPSQIGAVARLQRLRAGFGLNYAALGLVVDLLDRIARLETAQRRRPPTAPSSVRHATASRSASRDACDSGGSRPRWSWRGTVGVAPRAAASGR